MLDCGHRLYTGIALDPEQRFAAHLSKSRGARFTRAFPPRRIAYSVQLGSRSLASRAEARIKRLPRSCKLDIVAEQFSPDALLLYLGLA